MRISHKCKNGKEDDKNNGKSKVQIKIEFKEKSLEDRYMFSQNKRYNPTA